MEAIFIALGCLVPVFLNIAMNRRSNKSNNFYAWMVVGVVGAIMVLMMYMSSNGVKEMNFEDKKKSVQRSLESVKDRVGLKVGVVEESALGDKINAFVEDIGRL